MSRGILWCWGSAPAQKSIQLGMGNKTDTEHTILLSASLVEPVTVLFEPVGAERVLAAGEHLRFVISGPKDETIEMMHGRDTVTVWPGPRLEVRVFDQAGHKIEVLGW
jgi:hypothetical protein